MRDPAEVPRALSVLAAMGFVAWLARKRLRVAAWLLVAAAPFVAFSNLLQLDPPRYNWRSQVVLMPLLVLLAATVFDEALRLADTTLRRLAAALAVLVPAASMATALPALRVTGDQQEEFAFVRAALSGLPARGKLLVLTESRRELWGALPRTLLLEAGRELELVDLGRALDEGSWPAADDLLYYESMMCHTASPSSPAEAALHPACAKVRERYELVPVREHEVTGEPYNSLTYLPRPWRIGFYRLRAKGGGGPLSAPAGAAFPPAGRVEKGP
jgi:hypothetical protein